MILDKIENISRYGLDLNFIPEDLETGVFLTGKNQIKIDEKYYIGLEYQTKNESQCLWEAHRKYLDIHILIEGVEIIKISELNFMQSTKEYEDDYELFEGEAQQTLVLKEGYFLILYPNEVHKTSIQYSQPLDIRKKVYKLRID